MKTNTLFHDTGIRKDSAMSADDLFGVCPLVTSQKIINGKWSIYILYLLQNGPVRFNELLRMMPEKMTPTTLSRQLKFLEEKELIIRTEYSETLPRVEYSLSEIGQKFDKVISALGEWGTDYITFINSQEASRQP